MIKISMYLILRKTKKKNISATTGTSVLMWAGVPHVGANSGLRQHFQRVHMVMYSILAVLHNSAKKFFKNP
jgi:hypothetical protein